MAAKRLLQAWSRLRDRVRAGIRRLPHVLCDLLGFAGAGLVSYGSWLIYAPSGFLVGGILLMVFALLIGRRLDASKS